MDSLKIYGVKIDNTSLDKASKTMAEYLNGDKVKTIFTPNTEILMAAKKDNNLIDLINRADLVIPDGIGLIYASRIKKKPLRERVTGYDLSMRILDLANEKGYSIYLLGGKEGIARQAGLNIKKNYPNIILSGYHNGYFKGSHNDNRDSEEELNIIKDINSVKPDIIFVGLGFPKQEIWIDQNKERVKTRIIIGNGGVMDIISGNSKRAPETFQKLGLEWLYRLVNDPTRLRRQLALPRFMIEVIFKKNIIE